ncbi:MULTISPECIES: DUF4956 domain-containing protein [Prochlorococcus]|uniref:DUF4956 domain-containing protein n=1 Tax=Prochlorococcus marinus str. MIT 9116 TaxID=167544 RepID=A0A0A1ZXY0_PROMR|nr:DUF4956 domain-containing protein [Prochlorococcus marinus]KGF91710.1 hypothetical protein EU92_0455 [Prochlorococcus marinus str. MIT 9107]KGF93104.1 hypothetical protein EU93_0279 [Prochlorococcus marinus str. MIT 9116]KGF95075.1 hypothetical protein EU94_0373 [Prochlorococcus marinus str. MIT 9123]
MNNTILDQLSVTTGGTSVVLFSYSIVLSFILSYILSKSYIYFSKSLSNPYSLFRVLPLIAIGTTIIIAVIKSSLALSLGLVGALSIVRFRTPIKEPEELSFIFFSVGIGIACGAYQYKAAIVGLALIIVSLYLLKRFDKKVSENNLIRISITCIRPEETSGLINLITKYSKTVDFNNLSVTNADTNQNTSLALTIMPINKEFTNIDYLANEIAKTFPSASFTILDSQSF